MDRIRILRKNDEDFRQVVDILRWVCRRILHKIETSCNKLVRFRHKAKKKGVCFKFNMWQMDDNQILIL